MVSIRCKMVVSDEITKLGLHFTRVETARRVLKGRMPQGNEELS
jgi:hypothetical protein